MIKNNIAVLELLQKDLHKLASAKKAKLLARFFKTGPGEYGEGDIFIGVMVPDTRRVAKAYSNLSLPETKQLLYSKIHEARLCALLLLIEKFKRGNEQSREQIFKLYLKHTTYINNWDLVDLSAHRIVGEYLADRPKNILYKLVRSKSLWERRIAVIATFNFINRGEHQESIKLAKILLADKEDLIQKAVGWMLREVGKRCSEKILEDFLRAHYKKMPRTMLRYAIERLPEVSRKAYLTGLV